MTRADSSAPLLTQYDGSSGSRVELSRATAANWVAKTANLLLDEFALGAGDRAAVLLPLHWQAVTALLACWRVGVTTRLLPPGALLADGAAVLLAPADRLGEAREVAAGTEIGAEVVGFSLHPLGAPLPPGASAGIVDYATVVLGCADLPPPAVPADLPVHDAGSGDLLTGGELAELGVAWAQRHELGAADRLLTNLPLDHPDGLAAAVLAPVAFGAAAVLVTGDQALASDRLAGWADQERVTATAGVSLPGLRRLA